MEKRKKNRGREGWIWEKWKKERVVGVQVHKAYKPERKRPANSILLFIFPFASISQLFCQFAIVEEHCSPPVFLSLRLPFSALSFIHSANLLSCGGSGAVFSAPFYSLPLSLKNAVKRVDYWMALKLLSVSWSPPVYLSLFHSCFYFLFFYFFWATLSHAPSSLLSFNFIWGWGLVNILSPFRSFTLLLSALPAIVSH